MSGNQGGGLLGGVVGGLDNVLTGGEGQGPGRSPRRCRQRRGQVSIPLMRIPDATSHEFDATLYTSKVLTFLSSHSTTQGLGSGLNQTTAGLGNAVGQTTDGVGKTVGGVTDTVGNTVGGITGGERPGGQAGGQQQEKSNFNKYGI
ncbi:hypothetical protein PG997_012962 [Apiospora hydei]|uniref:Uncharacterized protein n=1 Tax=Apiospora hydei TaxID=1337664 RepID=A0ABR1V7H3_9PEZI